MTKTNLESKLAAAKQSTSDSFELTTALFTLIEEARKENLEPNDQPIFLAPLMALASALMEATSDALCNLNDALNDAKPPLVDPYELGFRDALRSVRHGLRGLESSTISDDLRRDLGDVIAAAQRSGDGAGEVLSAQA